MVAFSLEAMILLRGCLGATIRKKREGQEATDRSKGGMQAVLVDPSPW